MVFPLTLNGTVKARIPAGCPAPEEVVLNGLAQALREVKATAIVQDGSTIGFTVRFLRLVWNGNILNTIGWGAIAVEREADRIKVTYRLSMARWLFIISAFAGVAFAITFSHGGLGRAAMVSGAVLGWMFGGAYVLTLVRFHWLTRSRTRDALDHWAASAKGG